ncbi:hypothetical protein MMC20_005509 [Loxospora ochrophaea]|nr:hypothetical protein [Loxospora ochrophaea]
MIVRKGSPPTLYLSTPPPELSPPPSVVFSDCDADDEETMSAEESIPSRPLSVAVSQGNVNYHRPTLQDVLSNSAPSPWTLSAFTAYLSQNHCLETLEFTMDAARYRAKYHEISAHAGTPIPRYEECEHVRRLWQKLMDAYIIPNGPREVNIPGNVRDHLLSLPNKSSPPPPEELDMAVNIINELMAESVLVPFVNEVSASRYNGHWDYSDENGSMRSSAEESVFRRSRSKRRPSPSSSSLKQSSSPSGRTGSRFPQSSNLTAGIGSRGRLTAHASSGSTGSGEAVLTDDSESASSPGKEPMTPPTTPPSSDVGGSSPRSRSDNTWKKMMGRLGGKKKSASGMRTIEDEG